MKERNDKGDTPAHRFPGVRDVILFNFWLWNYSYTPDRIPLLQDDQSGIRDADQFARKIFVFTIPDFNIRTIRVGTQIPVIRQVPGGQTTSERKQEGQKDEVFTDVHGQWNLY